MWSSAAEVLEAAGRDVASVAARGRGRAAGIRDQNFTDVIVSWPRHSPLGGMTGVQLAAAVRSAPVDAAHHHAAIHLWGGSRVDEHPVSAKR